MKPLFTELELNSTRPSDFLPCTCYHCGNAFNVQKKLITYEIKNNRGRHRFCSVKCHTLYHQTRIEHICSVCQSVFIRTPSDSSKSGKYYCSHSCAAIYNNAHKTKGIRVSKAELHIQKELKKLYPVLPMLFNDSTTINSELDIYIPSIKFGVELNGIFHYEPIFGKDRLSKIQNNDERKFQACLEKEIELCIIDISQMKYFKEDKCEQYLNIITSIIDHKLNS